MKIMKILSIAYADQSGGAERIALELHLSYLKLGYDARLLVKHRFTDYQNISTFPRFNGRVGLSYLIKIVAEWVRARSRFRGKARALDCLAALSEPRRIRDYLIGNDNYSNNVGVAFYENEDWIPDFIHCHNLHGGYFDLSVFKRWDPSIPVIITAHDTWLITGHCGYFVDCDRWTQGCGSCPDLRRYPRIRRDRTAQNLIEKRANLACAPNLHLSFPSQWLLDLFQSARFPCKNMYLVPYGVDLGIFNPGIKARSKIREQLNLPSDKVIIMGSAASLSKANPYKDPSTVVEAIIRLQKSDPGRFFGILLGAGGGAFSSGSELLFPGYIKDPNILADYYRAADIFVHAARADNFPCTILESQACGTPVVATAVGGVPEQLIVGETGLLVERENVASVERAILSLANDRELPAWRARAAEYAQLRFDGTKHATRYLNLMSALKI